MSTGRPRIAFVSAMDGGSWGDPRSFGQRQHFASRRRASPFRQASTRWHPPHRRIGELLRVGVRVQQRPRQRTLASRAMRKIFLRDRSSLTADVEKWLRASPPTLIVLSTGDVLPPLELMELCIDRKWPFVTLGHTNYEGLWPYDETAERLRRTLPRAVRCYFVSNANLQLVESRLSFAIA